MKKTARLRLRCSEKFHEELKKTSRDLDVTVSKLIRTIITNWLKRKGGKK